MGTKLNDSSKKNDSLFLAMTFCLTHFFFATNIDDFLSMVSAVEVDDIPGEVDDLLGSSSASVSLRSRCYFAYQSASVNTSASTTNIGEFPPWNIDDFAEDPDC